MHLVAKKPNRNSLLTFMKMPSALGTFTNISPPICSIPESLKKTQPIYISGLNAFPK